MKIGDLVDYGSILCRVTVVSDDKLVIKDINRSTIYKVRIDDINLSKKIESYDTIRKS